MSQLMKGYIHNYVQNKQQPTLKKTKFNPTASQKVICIDSEDEKQDTQERNLQIRRRPWAKPFVLTESKKTEKKLRGKPPKYQEYNIKKQHIVNPFPTFQQNTPREEYFPKYQNFYHDKKTIVKREPIQNYQSSSNINLNVGFINHGLSENSFSIPRHDVNRIHDERPEPDLIKEKKVKKNIIILQVKIRKGRIIYLVEEKESGKIQWLQRDEVPQEYYKEVIQFYEETVVQKIHKVSKKKNDGVVFVKEQ